MSSFIWFTSSSIHYSHQLTEEKKSEQEQKASDSYLNFKKFFFFFHQKHPKLLIVYMFVFVESNKIKSLNFVYSDFLAPIGHISIPVRDHLRRLQGRFNASDQPD